MAAIIGALIGAIFGGLVRAIEAHRARRAEASALLSSLVAEVETLTRLVHHRGFIPQIIAFREHAAAVIASGAPDAPVPFLQIKLIHNYFVVFEASAPKLGLLHPYFADRISRFYTYLKAARENYDPTSPFQEGISAREAFEVFDSDLQLLHTVVALGADIATFRPVTPPKGVADTFGAGNIQPPLPPSRPELSSQQAGEVTAGPAG